MTYPAVYGPTYAADTATGSFEIDVTGLPVVPPPVPWRFLLATPQTVGSFPLPPGTILGEVTQAQTRSLTLRAGPTNFHEASLDIDGYSAAAALIAELQCDLQVMYGSQILAVLRAGGVTDQLTASAYRCQPAFFDYRQVLRRRSFAYGGGPPFTGADIAAVAWDIIQAGAPPDAAIQSYPGGDLGIARGLGRAGVGITATINYIRQDFIGTVIDSLCQLTPGADWDVTPYGPTDLRLDMWSPARGSDRGVVLTWGDGKVASITRTTDPSQYANSVFVTGQSITNTPSAGSAGALDASDIASRIEGRWDQVIGTQHTSQSSLDKAAAWYLNDQQVVLPSYTITLHPGAWLGPSWLYLGDLVTVRIAAGRLQVDDKLPVTEMDFAIDANGLETLTLTVGRVPYRIHTAIPKMLQRLKRLDSQ